MNDPSEIVIIGAGLSGLACAKRLRECDISCTLLEASDAVGGRVRTDLVDGFRLDRGFQIYLTAYPEGKRVLDLPALQLKPFRRGALIRYRGRFCRFADPLQSPWHGMQSLFNPIGTFRDKFRVLFLAWSLSHGRPEQQWNRPEKMTLDLLRWNAKFTPHMIDHFFRPFFGGVTLDRELTTSSRLFRYLFRMFAWGEGAIPSAGMQAIPEQLAAALPRDSIRLQTRVRAIEKGRITLTDDSELSPRIIVVATEGREAARLIGDAVPEPASRGLVTLYYTAITPPVEEATLVPDGDGTGPVNHLVVLSQAAASYAPAGQHLISATVVGIPPDNDLALDNRARSQLTEWYGREVAQWRLLRIDRIPDALPAQPAGALEPPQRPCRIYPGLYVCGDHRDNASIDGALTSGFRTAQTLMDDRHRGIV